MTVLCSQLETIPSWVKPTRKRPGYTFPGDYVKIISPGRGIRRLFPNKTIVGRYFFQNEDRLLQQGAAGAREYFNIMWPKYEENRDDVDITECINEPVVQTLEQANNLNYFMMMWLDLMQANNLPGAIPAWSLGNPPIELLGAMKDMYIATPYETSHQYGVVRLDEPQMNDHIFRHRKMWDAMEKLGIPIKPLLITECGLDRTSIGGGGYRVDPHKTSWDDYREQLLWMAQHYEWDGIVAAFLFVTGATKQWKSFDVGLGEWNDLKETI